MTIPSDSHEIPTGAVFLNRPSHIKHMFMVGNFAQSWMAYDKFDH